MKWISTAGLCVLLSSLTAFAAPLSTRQDQPRVLIDPALFPTLQRYARFSVASLATFIFGFRKCPNPPYGAPVVALIENIVTDTQAAVFRDDNAREFVLSFVGSSSIQDFITDFSFIPVQYNYSNIQCPGCSVHIGFYGSFLSVSDKIVSTLTDLTNKYPGYSVVITGHSLGGALAAISYPSLKSSTKLPIKAAYTYGSPRVGNAAFADFTDRVSETTDSSIGTLYRVTHNTDGVPNLPSESVEYRHSRTEFFQLDNAAGTQVAETTFRCFGQEAPDCNRGVANGFINADHLEYSGITMTNGQQCGIGA